MLPTGTGPRILGHQPATGRPVAVSRSHPAKDFRLPRPFADPANLGQTSIGAFFSDMTYYTNASAGTRNWIPALDGRSGCHPDLAPALRPQLAASHRQ